MSAASSRHPLVRLLRHAREHRGRFALASICSVLNKLFDLAPPFLIGVAVDVVVNREDSFLAALGVVDPGRQLWVLAGVTLVIWMLESAFEYAQRILWRNLAQTLQHALRVEAYDHVQRLDMAFFEDRSSGGLLSVLGEDVNQLERFLDGGANALLQVACTVLVISGVFFAIAPSVAWLGLLPMPLILWGSIRFQRRIGPRYARVREEAGHLFGQLADNVGGIATIKAYTAEARETARIGEASDAYVTANRRAIRLSSAFAPLIRMVIVVGFTAILVFGGHLVLEGRLAAGLYAVMVFLTQRLLWPLTRIGETLDLYQRAMASTRRLLDLLDAEATITTGATPLPRETLRGAVRFEGVSFGYADGPDVLHDLDLELEAGCTTAIVGPTGSGKSTVVKLLLRFHDVREGRITLDGHDLRDLDLDDLRRAIAFVSQDVFLFPGTVHDNVAYARPGAAREEVEAACRTAEADAFVRDLPQGYDTRVGERGQRLSGGQRQRLSIARAILADAPILVLDEATSAVDNETEAAIQRSLDAVARDRTVIVIAHRLSTVRHADRIHVLSRGRRVESGTHETLLAEDGLYASLWRVQTGEAHAAALEGESR